MLQIYHAYVFTLENMKYCSKMNFNYKKFMQLNIPWSYNVYICNIEFYATTKL
jgi:hypothetical protein